MHLKIHVVQYLQIKKEIFQKRTFKIHLKRRMQQLFLLKYRLYSKLV